MNAHGDKPTRGLPGGILLAITLLAVFGAWHLGYIDRMAYQSSLEKAGENVSVSRVEPTRENSAQATVALPYAYSTLSADDQKKYRIVLAAIEAREEQPYPVADLDDLTRIYKCVKADHPELFCDSGIELETLTNGGSGIVERVTVRAEFAHSAAEEAVLERKVAARAESCLAGIPAGSGDYATAKFLYEWLVDNVTYDHEAAGDVSQDDAEHAYAQTVEGALVEGRAVCAGYAKALAYLLQASGIQCVVATGTVAEGDHAWCVARLDGEYYCIDPTWGDLQIDGGDSGFVNYDYLNVADAVFSRTHAADSPFSLPACAAEGDNYYVREGLLFEAADGVRFDALATDALAAGRALQVRCADVEVYGQLRSLLEGGWLAGLSRMSHWYSVSDENLSITVFPAG